MSQSNNTNDASRSRCKPLHAEARHAPTHWTTEQIEEDRREEWLALSVLCALRKVS